MVLLQILHLCNYYLAAGKAQRQTVPGGAPINIGGTCFLPAWLCLFSSPPPTLKESFQQPKMLLRDTVQIKGVQILRITGRELNPFPYAKGEQAKCKPFIPHLHKPKLHLASKWVFVGLSTESNRTSALNYQCISVEESGETEGPMIFF